ncbi:hypothetical protein [Actinomadura sp. 9N407]|uniref:hypothetical protein n=1 Tax=Actinomadura sp. 9N407 TaxID=3375154 RepID=UPI00379A61E5
MAYTAVDQGERLKQQAGIRSVQLGDMRVSYVPDGAVHLRARDLFPDTTSEVWATRPEFLNESGDLVASIAGLLVENGDAHC